MTTREHRLLLVGVTCYALALLVLSRLVLPELAVEADGYAERGAELMAGRLVGDIYHPFLYPELIALLGTIVGNAEIAARAVSGVMAGVFVYVSYRFGRQLFGRRPAIATAVLLAANSEVVQYGIRSTSDMTAAACFMAAMWLLVAANGRRRWLGAAGVCIGLATAARMNFLFLVSVLAIAAAFRPSGRGGFWVFGGGALVGMLPNVVPNMLVFGAPLTSDNWRNMAFKVTGDVKALTDPPYAGLFDLLRQDGQRLLGMACDDFAAVWTRHLGQAMAGGHAVSPTPLVMTLLVPLGVVWLPGWGRGGARCLWPWSVRLMPRWSR